MMDQKIILASLPPPHRKGWLDSRPLCLPAEQLGFPNQPLYHWVADYHKHRNNNVQHKKLSSPQVKENTKFKPAEFIGVKQ